MWAPRRALAVLSIGALWGCGTGDRTQRGGDTARAAAPAPAGSAAVSLSSGPRVTGPLAGDTLDLARVGSHLVQDVGGEACDPVVPYAFARMVFRDDSTYRLERAVHPACLDPRPAALDTESRIGLYKLHGDTLTLYSGIGREVDETYNGLLFPDSVVQIFIERDRVTRYARRPAQSHRVAAAGPASPARPLRDRWDSANAATVRLAPAAFPQLPTAIRVDLERRGCRIPQVPLDTVPGNVVSGSFRERGKTDWAVLCSRDDTSRILVYWSGSSEAPDTLAASGDRTWLQQGLGPGIGFSRAIGVASPAYIREHFERYGGPTPPALDHDGINDIFVEKASTVLYWHQGRWLMLTGAD